MSILWNSLSWVHWMILLYCSESGMAKVSRILGVASLTLSLCAFRLSFTLRTLSAMCFLIFSFTSKSYFFLSVFESPAYHASNAAFFLMAESRW